MKLIELINHKSKFYDRLWSKFKLNTWTGIPVWLLFRFIVFGGTAFSFISSVLYSAWELFRQEQSATVVWLALMLYACQEAYLQCKHVIVHLIIYKNIPT